MRTLAVLSVAFIAFTLFACGVPRVEPQDLPAETVSADWLADHLEDENLVVLDARTDLEDYLSGHLPGALHLTVDALQPGAAAGTALPPALLRDLLGQFGIESHSHVVVYASGRTEDAHQVADLLRLAGISRVSVLDGGLESWEGEGLPTDATPA